MRLELRPFTELWCLCGWLRYVSWVLPYMHEQFELQQPRTIRVRQCEHWVHVHLRGEVVWSSLRPVPTALQLVRELCAVRQRLHRLPNVHAEMHCCSGLQRACGHCDRSGRCLRVLVLHEMDRTVLRHVPVQLRPKSKLWSMLVSVRLVSQLLSFVHRSQLHQPLEQGHRQQQHWLHVHVPLVVDWSSMRRVATLARIRTADGYARLCLIVMTMFPLSAVLFRTVRALAAISGSDRHVPRAQHHLPERLTAMLAPARIKEHTLLAS